MKQIDWIKELEEEEELKEWLDANKPEGRPMTVWGKSWSIHPNWWKRQPLDPDEEEYNLQKSTVFRRLMKKLNR